MGKLLRPQAAPSLTAFSVTVLQERGGGVGAFPFPHLGPTISEPVPKISRAE